MCIVLQYKYLAVIFIALTFMMTFSRSNIPRDKMSIVSADVTVVFKIQEDVNLVLYQLICETIATNSCVCHLPSVTAHASMSFTVHRCLL